jgi:hypothetical protein
MERCTLCDKPIEGDGKPLLGMPTCSDTCYEMTAALASDYLQAKVEEDRRREQEMAGKACLAPEEQERYPLMTGDEARKMALGLILAGLAVIAFGVWAAIR